MCWLKRRADLHRSAKNVPAGVFAGVRVPIVLFSRPAKNDLSVRSRNDIRPFSALSAVKAADLAREPGSYPWSANLDDLASCRVNVWVVDPAERRCAEPHARDDV